MVAYDEALDRCPLCVSESIGPYDHDQYRGNTISRCRECGVKFMSPQYSDQYLVDLYSRYTFRETPDKHRCKTEVRTVGKQRAFALLGQYVEPGRVLMIGCGDGLELRIAADAGWNVEGYDIDAATAEEAAKQAGVPVHHGRFEQLGLADGSFDAIYMDQVIEHPKDPAIYFEQSWRLLRPGGVLYLGTPNIGSLSNSLKTLIGKLGLRGKRRGKHYATQHHLFFFTPGVMRGLLARYGFRVLETRGSMKPQEKPLTAALSRWFPFVDSSFVVLAQKS